MASLARVIIPARRSAFAAARTFSTSVAQTYALPKTGPAAVVPERGTKVEIKQIPVPQQKDLKSGEVVVELTHSGVCHSDLHLALADWAVKPSFPFIGGHEGVGKVVAVADHTPNSPVKVGDRVGVKWVASSCGTCYECLRGFETHCENVQLSGYTTEGTFAKYIKSWANTVTPIPEGVDSATAGPLLCAGVTVYKALKVSHTKTGDWIAIPGAGGGLGHLAVQYAKAMGLKVIAIDTGADKEKLLKGYGIDAWIDFKKSKNLTQDIQNATPDKRGPHAALVVSASSSGYAQAIDYLRIGGTLVCVGLPDAPLDANIFNTVFKQIRIQASYVGTRQDAIEALAFAAQGKVKVNHVVKPIDQLESIFHDLEKGNVPGRIVVEF